MIRINELKDGSTSIKGSIYFKDNETRLVGQESLNKLVSSGELGDMKILGSSISN